MTKPTQWRVRSAKTHISLRIHPALSESLLFAWRSLRSFSTNKAYSEDSDQTGPMPRLIWVFSGRIDNFVDFVMLRPINVVAYNQILTQICFVHHEVETKNFHGDFEYVVACRVVSPAALYLDKNRER